MAKYTVTFSCGHTDTVELFGKDSDRKEKLNISKNKESALTAKRVIRS